MVTAFRHCVFAIFPLSVGCAQQPANPSFSVTTQEASRDLDRISAAPKSLDRPLLIIGGFGDPGLGSIWLRENFTSLTGDRRITDVELFECLSFDACRDKVIAALDHDFPGSSENETVEVDVIGYSMGGLVARYASLPSKNGKQKRLRVARLFTISSPLQGANNANVFPLLHPLQKGLRTGSALLNEINASQLGYPVYSYVRLGDGPVGAPNAAVPGRTAWWVPTPFLNSPHGGAFCDPRIVADIARRLRDETPWATEPPAMLPERS